MKKLEKEILDAVKAGDLAGAQWILTHRRVKVSKSASARSSSPYISTIYSTVICEHLGVEPTSPRKDEKEGTYLIADLSVPGAVTLTAERKV